MAGPEYKELIRLLAALICGVAIGFDRSIKRRGPGIRTHILVCVGATVVMLTSEKLLEFYPEYVGDIARLGAQVISGVGFLGVGTIIVTGNRHVRGLTTAAGLWATACIGLAIGIGYFKVAALATLLIVFTFRALGITEDYIHKHSILRDYYILVSGSRGVLDIMDLARGKELKLSDLEIRKSADNSDSVTVFISLEGKRHDEFIRGLQESPNVESIETIG